MISDKSVRTVVHILLLTLGVLTGSARADEWKLLFDLRGQWKFEIGDDKRRAEPGYNDGRWDNIEAPAAWEDEGYPGYDGYAWYRKHFISSENWKNKYLSLHLGYIDDVDEVFVNGRVIGSTGSFPPNYSSAYTAERIYPLPVEYLNPNGDNVIAVRVYDQELSGGILRGRLGIFEDMDPLRIAISLTSGWKFSTGDDPAWKEERFDDHAWDNIEVPAFWETQGYPKYDGYAWYRIRFTISDLLLSSKLILLLGKIDDYDQTFINGHEIGHTGNMATRRSDIPGSDAYMQLRAYLIPTDYLYSNRENVLAVRVYDGYKDGGIYAGPIGIVARDNYLKWKDHNSRKKDFLDWFFK